MAYVHGWEIGESENSRWMVESLLEIIAKRRSQSFYKSMDIHSVTNVGESIFSISMSNTRLFHKKFFYNKINLKNPKTLIKKMLRKSATSNVWVAIFKNTEFT